MRVAKRVGVARTWPDIERIWRSSSVTVQMGFHVAVESNVYLLTQVIMAMAAVDALAIILNKMCRDSGNSGRVKASVDEETNLRSRQWQGVEGRTRGFRNGARVETCRVIWGANFRDNYAIHPISEAMTLLPLLTKWSAGRPHCIDAKRCPNLQSRVRLLEHTRRLTEESNGLKGKE